MAPTKKEPATTVPTPAPVDATADDELLVSTIEKVDEYLSDQQHAIELLKQGFLKLTMAKMNLAAHAVGELSYKEEFESALFVSEESDGTLTTIKRSSSAAVDSSDSETKQQQTGNSLTMRRNRQAISGGEADTDTSSSTSSKEEVHPRASHAPEEDAAIMWFSSLPPQNLRLAQKNFRNALHALLVCAASARQIQSAVHQTTSQ